MNSRSNSNYKIFKSLFYLNYKDPKLESHYRKNGILSSSKMLGIFINIIFTYSLLICLFETFLSLNAESNIGNILKWNIMFVYLNLIPISVNFIIFHFIPKFLERQNVNKISIFVLFFCFLNDNLSITSILRVYFKSSIELVSFVFFIKVSVEFLISLFVIRKFAMALTIISLNILFHYIFLLRLHVIREVLLYLITETIFSVIVILFIYMSEYWSRVFYYSYSKLEKEKKDNLETLKFFNISYFKIKNYVVTNHTKLDELLIFNTPKNYDGFGYIYPTNYHVTIKQIEYLFKNLISLDLLPKEIEAYLLETQRHNNFKFETFAEIFKKLEKFNFFENYSKIGVLKLRNQNKEDSYFQLFLRIKIKFKLDDLECKDEDESILSNLINKEIIKIEGIFMDVTQNYIKRQTQINSLILSKSIHDIKSPLFLLKQVIKKYEKHNRIISDQIIKLLKVEGVNIEPSTENSTKYNFKRNQFTLNEFSVNNGSNPLVNEISPLITENNKYMEILDTFGNLNTHSQSLKVISKNIFENIDGINTFTKQQNNYDDKSEIPSKEFSFKRLNIKKLIRSCIEFYKISVKYNPAKHNLKLLAVIDDKIPEFIYSNKIAVKQVIMNLLSNCLKFTIHGEIRVEANLRIRYELDEKRYIEIRVVDTGCGIDEDNISKLCKPFGLTTSDKYGSGLGLSIVHDFLCQVNSKLNIYSKKNKGSAFCFDLILDKNCQKLSDDVDNKDDESSSSKTSNSILLKNGCLNSSNNNIHKEKPAPRRSLKSCESSSVFKNESIRTISSANSSEESDDGDLQNKTVSTIVFNYISQPMNKYKIMDKNILRKLYPLSNVASRDRSPFGSPKHSPILSPFFGSPLNRSLEKSGPSENINNLHTNPRKTDKKFMTDIRNKKCSNNLKKIYLKPRKKLSKFSHFSKESENSFTKNLNLLEEPSCNFLTNIEIYSKKPSENDISYPYLLDLKKKSTNSLATKRSKDIKIINKIFNSHCALNTNEKILKILLVDDDPIYIQQLSTLIKSIATESDYIIKIDCSFNPIEGLINIYNLLKSHNEYYDLLLIDEQMPYMKGSCFSIMYKSILVRSGFYPLLIATISSDVVTHLKIDNLNQTFDYFLDKPVKKTELKKIVEQLIYKK